MDLPKGRPCSAPLHSRTMRTAIYSLFALGALAAPSLAQLTNIAPLGTASQSSTYVTYSDAGRAIDGFPTTVWSFGILNRLSSTGGAPGSWWQLDFPTPFEVSEVVLFNRSDCCALRLSNFRILVELDGVEFFGADYFVGSGSVSAGGIVSLDVPPGTMVDRVRVELINGLNNEGNGFLTLAEVEVLSPPIGSVYCSPAAVNIDGRRARLSAVGTASASSPDATAIVCQGLNELTFGFFLVGDLSNQVAPPGSNGVFCLGGNIGRYSNFIFDTARSENMALVIDRSAVPGNPVHPILAGETWRFQAWYRDGASSNFSDAVAVTFL